MLSTAYCAGPDMEGFCTLTGLLLGSKVELTLRSASGVAGTFWFVYFLRSSARMDGVLDWHFPHTKAVVYPEIEGALWRQAFSRSRAPCPCLPYLASLLGEGEVWYGDYWYVSVYRNGGPLCYNTRAGLNYCPGAKKSSTPKGLVPAA